VGSAFRSCLWRFIFSSFSSLCHPGSSDSYSKYIPYYVCDLLLDFRIAFVVDIHACNNFGDNRHGISVGFARVSSEQYTRRPWDARNKGL